VKQGVVQKDERGGLYRRIMLKPFAPLFDQSQMPDLKSWHGSPLAALRRGFIALSSIRITALPIDIRDGLRRLQELYSREPPPLSTTSSNMAQQLPVEANEGKRKCDIDDLERPSKIRSIERPDFQNRPATFDRADEDWVLGPQFTSWAAAERYGPLFSLRSSSMVEI